MVSKMHAIDHSHGDHAGANNPRFPPASSGSPTESQAAGTSSFQPKRRQSWVSRFTLAASKVASGAESRIASVPQYYRSMGLETTTLQCHAWEGGF